MHLAFGIRCDIGPCHIAGDVVIRVKGVQLPPRTKPKTRADFSGPTWLQLLERHEPRDIRLAVAGRTILYPPQWIVRSHEAEPHVEFSAYAEPNIRSGPLLQPGSLPGVLTFATNAGKVRIPVTVRITRRA
jgi:hypothetical protein